MANGANVGLLLPKMRVITVRNIHTPRRDGPKLRPWQADGTGRSVHALIVVVVGPVAEQYGKVGLFSGA